MASLTITNNTALQTLPQAAAKSEAPKTAQPAAEKPATLGSGDHLKSDLVGAAAVALPAVALYGLGAKLVAAGIKHGDGGIGEQLMGSILKQPIALGAVVGGGAALAAANYGGLGTGASSALGAAAGAATAGLMVGKYMGAQPGLIAAGIGALAGGAAGALGVWAAHKAH